jgi:signal transduction histidine kinase
VETRSYSRVAVEYQWARGVAFVVIAFVVVQAFLTSPAPGLGGRHLAVSVVLCALVGGTAALFRGFDLTDPWVVGLAVFVDISAGALVGLHPNDAGFMAVFPAVIMAAIRLPIRVSLAVTTTAVGSLAVGWTLSSDPRLSGIIQVGIAVVAFYTVSLFSRRLREANAQAQDLIAELKETRAAQAQAAALGERQRLAREMHDVLAHSLSGLVLNLEGARLLAARDHGEPAVADAIERAHRLARTGLEEARRAIGMLRDDELPGPHKLATLAAEFETDSGTACRFSVTGDERELGTDGGLTLYRVAQEALTNIRKHTRAERVEVGLSYEAAGTRLVVEDFGTHDAAPGDGTGYGLTGMRERAELLGGTLTAGPTAHGFRVEVWVPA